MQGAVVFQGRGHTLLEYAERLKNNSNAVDGSFYDAV